MHVSRSSRAQRPMWRKPASCTPIGVSSRSAGNSGNSASTSSSTFLQPDAQACSAGIVEKARNARLPKFGHTRPQNPSIVCDRLSASKPVLGRDRLLRAQLAQPRHRRDVPHRHVVAQLAVGAEREKVRQSRQRREAVGRDPGDVPEQIEVDHAFETSQAGEPVVGERPVDQQMPDDVRIVLADSRRSEGRARSSAAGRCAAAAGPRRSPAGRC